MKTVLILGATGQVGQALLQLALQHPEISRVVAPMRRPLPPHANLDNPLVDFYLKTKGETEQALTAMGFASLVLVRPSLLIGDPRSSARALETFGLFLGKHLSSLLPRRYRAVTTRQVAQALLEAGLSAPAGLHVIESEQLQV